MQDQKVEKSIYKTRRQQRGHQHAFLEICGQCRHISQNMEPLKVHKEVQMNDWTVAGSSKEIEVFNLQIMDKDHYKFCLFRKSRP